MLNFSDVALRRGSRLLFSGATFNLFRGEKVGLTGVNGSGKSSLLAMMRGELQPDAGSFEKPGNLGTILRSAEAAGVQSVFLTPGTTDPFSPKVARAGMGAHFRLPIFTPDWETLAAALAGLNVFHADMAGAQTCWQADFTSPCALLIGSEAEGISPKARDLVTQSVRIPMRGASESLNAAVSAAILLFEALRQRSVGVKA